MAATINNTWAAYNEMDIKHSVVESIDGLGTIDLPDSVWDALISLLPSKNN